jgi:hypothetical protein
VGLSCWIRETGDLSPVMSNEKRLEFFDRPVEPTLQRELKHKGTVIGDGSYSAELIAYVEFYQNFHIILTYRLDR